MFSQICLPQGNILPKGSDHLVSAMYFSVPDQLAIFCVGKLTVFTHVYKFSWWKIWNFGNHFKTIFSIFSITEMTLATSSKMARKKKKKNHQSMISKYFVFSIVMYPIVLHRFAFCNLTEQSDLAANKTFAGRTFASKVNFG